MILGTLRTLPALALTTAAKTLRLLAAVNESIADRLAPGEVGPGPAATQQDPGAQQETAGAQQDTAPATQDAAAAAGPAAASSPGSDAASSSADTPDIPTLAARTAPQVIAAIDGLSTTELGELFTYESRHRRRRSVLNALEAASAPPAPVADEDLPPLDVRVDDEVVYSTSTPNR